VGLARSWATSKERGGDTPSESAATEQDGGGGEEEIFSLGKGWSKEYQVLGAEVWPC